MHLTRISLFSLFHDDAAFRSPRREITNPRDLTYRSRLAGRLLVWSITCMNLRDGGGMSGSAPGRRRHTCK